MPETVLLDLAIPRTLHTLLARFATPEWAGARLEAWLFEDEAARRTGERQLVEAGVSARLRSAYKPLLHHALEEHLPSGSIRLPSHPGAAPHRFALESYPLAALAPSPLVFATGAASLDHELADGTLIFAPNRPGLDPRGRPILSPCGWLRVWRGAEQVIDTELETEFETCFARVLQAVRAHFWPAQPPYFPTLHIQIATSGISRPLAVAHECIDTREALHEDLYFSLLELFQAQAGLPAGDRTLQPGQIVPDITATDGPTHVRVSIRGRLPDTPDLGPEDLETATRAPDPATLDAALSALPGEAFTVTSVQGRRILGLHRQGRLPGLVVTAGQHANETSGPVGLLRAAPSLLAEPHANIALVPLENPDGYALHRHLCATHPRHMHHAARYTALGDDLEARTAAPWHETEARRTAIARTQARLHLSLHGYPAQEWTRPLSGYVPQDFSDWTLPCGYFLILRHHPGLRAQGLAFLQALTAELAKDPELVAMNRAQLALRAAHAPTPETSDDTLILSDIPCRISENRRSVVPFVLITEYPDETILNDAFRRSHTVQRNTVLAAARLLWDGALNEAPDA